MRSLPGGAALAAAAVVWLAQAARAESPGAIAAKPSSARAAATGQSEPLLDLKAGVPAVTEDNFHLEMDLSALAADKDGEARKVTVQADRVDGQWKPGTAQPYRAPPMSKPPADASGLRLEGRRLVGDLQAAGRTVRLDAAVTDAGPNAPWPKDDIDIRTWPYYYIYCRSQGAAWELAGTYEADGRAGQVTGFFSPPLKPGFWNMGSWKDGLRLDFDLGAKRQNWNYGRLAVYEFAAPRDLSAWSGLRLAVATDRPRSDVEVAVWLRESDGSWYHVKSAVPLVDAENAAVVLFEDFTEANVASPAWSLDEDCGLDLGAISHLAIGVLNPLGVGRVSFTVTGLDLVRMAAGPRPPAQVAVTGRMLSVNGHEVVPAGLFGGYAGDLPQEFRPGCGRSLGSFLTVLAPGRTETFWIDCWHDRYQSASALTNGRWRRNLRERGRAFARRAREAGVRGHLEFWNEPYLNWTRSLKNFQPSFFERRGGDVVVRATGQKVPYFAWEGGQVADTTQPTYYSARGNGMLYDEMLLEVARAAKEENPAVQVLVSWGFRWKTDGWQCWDLEYKPSVDRCLPWIDGACEHHYGGDATGLIGMYEVLAAYGKTKYNKWLYSYNTEAGDLTRVPVGGRVDTPAKAANLTQYRMAMYEVRDILSCASQTPDKMRSRTLLTWRSQAARATPVAYRLLRNVRGRLVLAESDDPKVWCVASVDGTDPDAMPREPGLWLVAAVFNDHIGRREVDLVLSAPAGTTFQQGRIERIVWDEAAFDFRLVEEEAAAAGTHAALHLDLAGRSVWKIALPLQGTVPASPQVQRRQFFSPDILQAVARGRPLATRIVLDPAALAAARRAWLRLVIEDVALGEGTVRVGIAAPQGRPCVLEIPKAMTAGDDNDTVMVPVDVAALAPETALEFSVNPGNFAGYRVDVASVVLETP